MGFGTKKIKAKARAGRGSLDAQAIEEALIGAWEALQDELDEQEEAVQDQIKAHFNNFNACGNLGDLLFGDASDFTSAVGNLKADEKSAYFEELFAQEIFDKQSIQDSLEQ